jgi:hypothetical protein
MSVGVHYAPEPVGGNKCLWLFLLVNDHTDPKCSVLQIRMWSEGLEQQGKCGGAATDTY